MRRPNLLFIYTDEQAAKTMAAYGNDLIETPNLDRLHGGMIHVDKDCVLIIRAHRC